MEKHERRDIARRYFVLFEGWSDAKIAEDLAHGGPRVTLRTIGRQRNGESVPNLGIASAMKRKLDDGTLTEEERLKRFEDQQARREAIQRAEHAFIRDEGARDYEDWVDRAFKRYHAREFDVVIDIMIGHVSADSVSGVPERHWPYVLNLLGSCYLERGLTDTAIGLFDRALVASTDKSYHAGAIRAIRLNHALALLLADRFDAALDQIEQIICDYPGYALAYYNALCIVSIRADHGYGDVNLLSRWLGRTQEAAARSFDPDTEILAEFMRRAQNDPDLNWARDQDTWSEFERWMLALKDSMQKQLSVKGEDDASNERAT